SRGLLVGLQRPQEAGFRGGVAIALRGRRQRQRRRQRQGAGQHQQAARRSMSSFWSWWVIVLVVINIVGALWLLFANRKVEVRGPSGDAPKTGHVYDGIEEYDNPLPAWWFKMFVGTAVFSVIYLILYPGLGNFKGVLDWTSTGEWRADVAAADEKYGPLFARYKDTPVEDLALDPEAMKMGARLFANNCSVCHGTDGRGG